MDRRTRPDTIEKRINTKSFFPKDFIGFKIEFYFKRFVAVNSYNIVAVVFS